MAPSITVMLQVCVKLVEETTDNEPALDTKLAYDRSIDTGI